MPVVIRYPIVSQVTFTYKIRLESYGTTARARYIRSCKVTESKAQKAYRIRVEFATFIKATVILVAPDYKLIRIEAQASNRNIIFGQAGLVAI